MTTKTLTLSIAATTALLTTSSFAEVTLDPIVVSADFREAKLSQTSNAITVIGEEKLYDKASQPLIEVLSSTPNVNFSAGASRAKYIQIRGMGERAQFETPINPSVGLMVDGIDFSNITLGASLFDVKQVEVLRGPQGTRFGTNALAGVVNIETKAPTKETEGHIEATGGNYNTKAFGAAVGGTLIEDRLLGRFSVYQNKSDGYIKNDYLNRDDTNKIDELTTRAKFRWLASDKHTVDLTLTHINIDNGYDMFNQSNDLTTQSDEPGKDKQKTNAFSLKSTYQVNSNFHVESQVSHSKTNSEYSFDEDWTYTGAWYTGFDQYQRDKKQTDIDVRLVSDEEGKLFNKTTNWTIGTYYKEYDSDLLRNNTAFATPFTSSYKADDIALYGQLDTTLTDKLTLTTGLRLEKWDTKYNDSDATNFDDSEKLFGGKVGLSYQNTPSQLLYATISKGYKPGGFNPVTTASGLQKEYQTESLWNLDLGANSSLLNEKLSNRTNLFYGKSKDRQVGVSYNNGTRYTDYITNAPKSHYYGVETTFDYYPNDNLGLFANLGLLKAKFDTFTNPTDNVSRAGRAPAQSPKYQYNLGFNYGITDELTLKSSLEGKDGYYFSNSHDEKSHSYKLYNASLEYTTGEWTTILWGRNLSDVRYQTRGFYFDNFGAGDNLYTQQGTPRTFGATVSYDF